MVKVIAICTSKSRREPKVPVERALFVEGKGILGDSHFGMVERQVSLLRVEDIREAEPTAGFAFPPGSLAENLLVEGLPEELVPGQALSIGPDVRLVVVEKRQETGRTPFLRLPGMVSPADEGLFPVGRAGRAGCPRE